MFIMCFYLFVYNDTYTEKIYMIRSYINTINIYLSSMTFEKYTYYYSKFKNMMNFAVAKIKNMK